MLIQRNEIFNPASQFMIDNQAKIIYNIVYHDCSKLERIIVGGTNLKNTTEFHTSYLPIEI